MAILPTSVLKSRNISFSSVSRMSPGLASNSLCGFLGYASCTKAFETNTVIGPMHLRPLVVKCKQSTLPSDGKRGKEVLVETELQLFPHIRDAEKPLELSWFSSF
ncbi:hypothetical protein VNO77_34017 [Canavalia gladiata]|uniref:Uncharacterized protein n=1 Tax=Canavalia gladiata TaxID=3824 RepID=A0AAN9PZG5_CANGL